MLFNIIPDFTHRGQVALLLHVNDPGLHAVHRLRGETRHGARGHGTDQVEAHVVGDAHGQGAAWGHLLFVGGVEVQPKG